MRTAGSREIVDRNWNCGCIVPCLEENVFSKGRNRTQHILRKLQLERTALFVERGSWKHLLDSDQVVAEHLEGVTSEKERKGCKNFEGTPIWLNKHFGRQELQNAISRSIYLLFDGDQLKERDINGRSFACVWESVQARSLKYVDGEIIIQRNRFAHLTSSSSSLNHCGNVPNKIEKITLRPARLSHSSFSNTEFSAAIRGSELRCSTNLSQMVLTSSKEPVKLVA